MKPRKIIASLKLTTPLHISMPDNRRYDVAKNQTVYNKDDATPLISTQVLQIVNPALSAAADMDLPEDDGPSILPVNDTVPQGQPEGQSQDEKKKTPQRMLLRVPAIMANNLVGHLRRHAAYHVLDALATRKETVSLPVYSCLQCGAWTGSPDGADLRYGEFLQAKKHPYLGLFGGGPRMIRRAFRATNAIPALTSLRESLHVPYCTDPMPEIPAGQLTQIAIFRRNDDLADLANLSMAARTLKDFETSLRTYEAAVLATGGMRSIEEKKAGAKVSSMTFSSMEFVIPGTSFDLSFDLFQDLTDAQIGLFLLSLDRFAQTDTLGGHSRNGFGRFFFDAVELDGTPVFRDGKLDLESPDVEPYILAWEAAANAMSVSELEYLFRVGGKKAKNKKEDDKAAKPSAASALDALVAEQQGKMAGDE